MSGANNTTINGQLLVGGDMISTGWHYVGTPNEPEYLNGWHGYNDPLYANARFRKEGNMVIVHGVVAGGTYSYSSNIFLLPVGYRPSARLIFISTAAQNIHVRVDVLPEGYVQAVGMAGNGENPPSWLVLNLRFSVDSNQNIREKTVPFKDDII